MSKVRNLVIDIGNTATKVAVYEMDAVVSKKNIASLNLKMLKALLVKYKPQNAIICSVINTPDSLIKYLRKSTNLIILSGRTLTPVKITYKTPETLGADRLASVCAASMLFPKRNVLVIDLGTCIKYDFLSASGKYLGGSISPGFNMRLKALHEHTGRLPLIKPANPRKLIGKSTAESILTGVSFGIQGEIEGFISKYKAEFGSIKVIITGGDAARFVGQLKIPIFAAPDLVSIGLNEILNFNVRK